MLFFELALEDLRRAADLFRPIHDQTSGVDGWVSLEVSPLLANDTAGTITAVRELHDRADRPSLFINIPGVPINVALLFSSGQYVAAAEVYLRGIERRLSAGLKPDVYSVASLFVSRWDVAVMGKTSDALCDRLGIAIPSGRTKRTATCSTRRADSGFRTPARGFTSASSFRPSA
jgi:transaldolase